MRGRDALALWLLFSLLAAGCARTKPAPTPGPRLTAQMARPTLTRTALPALARSAQARPSPTQALVGEESSPRPTSTLAVEVNLPLVAGPQERPSVEEVTPPPPGSDASIALVKDYLEALGRGGLQGAYKLLHETYQARVPYEDYVKGYAPLVGLELHAIEAVQVDEYKDLVQAGITLVTRKQGQTSTSDWQATFEVLVTRGKPPYQRSITHITMQRLPEGEP